MAAVYERAAAACLVANWRYDRDVRISAFWFLEPNAVEGVDSLLGELVRRGVVRNAFGIGDGEHFERAVIDPAHVGPRPFGLEATFAEAVGIEDRAARVGDVVDGVDDATRLQLVAVAFLGQDVVRRAGDDLALQAADRVVVDHRTERIRGEDVHVLVVDGVRSDSTRRRSSAIGRGDLVGVDIADDRHVAPSSTSSFSAFEPHTPRPCSATVRPASCRRPTPASAQAFVASTEPRRWRARCRQRRRHARAT